MAFLAGWLKRKKMTVDNTKVDADQTDFPVLVNRTDTDFSAAQADGFDFVVTKADGTTELKYEREEWVDGTGELILWFKADSISSSVDTIFYLYYDKDGVQASDKADPVNVYDSNFKLVAHLHDDLLDSTSNNNDGSNAGSTDIAGQIGDGQDFDGDNDSIDFGKDATLDIPGDLTISLWINADSLAEGENVWGQADFNSGGSKTQMGMGVLDSSDKPRFFHHHTDFTTVDITSDTVLTTGTWFYFVVTRDDTAETVQMYLDGDTDRSSASYTGKTVSPQVDCGNKRLGRLGDLALQHWNGQIDEFRISNTDRTSGWIKTEYNNQNSPSTFITFGAEETPSGRTVFQGTVNQSGMI